MTKYPQHLASKGTGRSGVRIFEGIIEEDFGWILRKVEQESDYGIDGFIDIVVNQNVTGRSLAVQLKSGQSYFHEKSEFGFYHKGEAKHLNLYANYPIPVLIVVCDVKLRKCWWVRFEISATEGAGKGWKIFIPWTNEVKAEYSKKWASIAGRSWDFTDDAKFNWAVTETLKSAKIIHYVIDRSDIESISTDHIETFIGRLTKQPGLRFHMQGKLMISVFGYDDDPRELWEIHEVRMWMAKAERRIKYWLWYSSLHPKIPTMFLLRGCTQTTTKVRVEKGRVFSETPLKEKKAFLLRHFGWLNQFCDQHDIPESTNREISEAFFRYWEHWTQ